MKRIISNTGYTNLPLDLFLLQLARGSETAEILALPATYEGRGYTLGEYALEDAERIILAINDLTSIDVSDICMSIALPGNNEESIGLFLETISSIMEAAEMDIDAIMNFDLTDDEIENSAGGFSLEPEMTADAIMNMKFGEATEEKED